MFFVDTKEQALDIIRRVREIALEKKKDFSNEDEMWMGRGSSLLSGIEKILRSTDDPDTIEKIIFLADLHSLNEVAGEKSVLRSYLLNLPGFMDGNVLAHKQHVETLKFLYPFLRKARREVLKENVI